MASEAPKSELPDSMSSDIEAPGSEVNAQASGDLGEEAIVEASFQPPMPAVSVTWVVVVGGGSR